MTDAARAAASSIKAEQASQMGIYEVEEGLLYGPGIADYPRGIVVVTNRRGSRLLLYEHNLYHKYYTQKNGVMWRCTEYKTKKCQAKFLIDNGKVIQSDIVHTHSAPKQMIIDKLRRRELMVNLDH